MADDLSQVTHRPGDGQGADRAGMALLGGKSGHTPHERLEAFGSVHRGSKCQCRAGSALGQPDEPGRMVGGPGKRPRALEFRA